eukprot:Nitzschia sp. Nitz4//scaffold113_size70149//58142//59398//NITZ4_005961-RA/size70149-processed-gene-0.79-mRNA-1//-1//CDS//3329533374//9205//frame0
MSDPPRRLVVFVGPHKSASSTVQEFLVQYATGRRKYRKLSAFQKWRWPIVKDTKIPARKQWAQLVIGGPNSTDPEKEAFRIKLKSSLQGLYGAFSSIVVGSEELDRFGTTPWSHRDGILALRQLIEWAQEDLDRKHTEELQVDVVVNYRIPRQAHWISIWKQLMSLDEHFHHVSSSSYPDWICQRNEAALTKVWEYLDCVSNPLGLAEAIIASMNALTRRGTSIIGWKVHLIDMDGVQRQGLDIAHVSACDIMGVPCSDGWVNGINRTLVVNSKSRSLDGVTEQHLLEMEWLLQQRDCAYLSTLQQSQDAGELRLLYKESLWKTCTSGVGQTGNFKDTSYLLDLLQSQFGCRSNGTFRGNILRDLMTSTMEGRARPAREEVFVSPNTPNGDLIIVQVLQWVLLAIMFIGLLRFRKRPP